MNKQKMFTHGKSNNGRRFTIAAVSKSIDDNTNEINIGFSICAENDNFNKKIGRVIAEGRAQKDSFLTFNIDNDAEGYNKVKEEVFGLKEKMSLNIFSYLKRNRK